MTDNPPDRPIIALDTTTLVQSIPSRGRFRPIIEAFDAGRLLLVVSTEILFEYREILEKKGGPTAWSSFEAFLVARGDFVKQVAPTYFWRAIRHDPDDNKFVDAAVAGEAE